MYLLCFILKLFRFLYKENESSVCVNENIVMKNPTKVSYWK